MKQPCATVLCLVVAVTHVAFAQSREWKEDLQDALESLYPRAQQARFEANQITKPGIVLVVKSDNIQAGPSRRLRRIRQQGARGSGARAWWRRRLLLP